MTDGGKEERQKGENGAFSLLSAPEKDAAREGELAAPGTSPTQASLLTPEA